MASLLPWDTLFLAGFAYSGYRTVGRWFKYTTDTAKAQTDAGYFEGFHEFLASQAASGDRSKAMPGAGAEASGQGHLWSGWQSMNAKQKIALLHEMQQVLEWTGQDAGFNALARYHGQPWSALPHAAKQALLAAADQLDWSFLKDMVQEGLAIAKSAALWQVTNSVPALSAEPALAEALIDEEKDLQELVKSADMAVNALLTKQQQVVIDALSPAQNLKVIEAKRKVDLLREAAQGGLGLGSGGKAARGQQLLELLRNITLIPADDSMQQQKADAAAALDAAADAAVQPLKDQHSTALAAAMASTRSQSLVAALSQRIRYRPGSKPLTATVAAGVFNVAADEVESAVSTVTNESSGVPARRAAAQQLKEMASIIDSTAAALAAATAGDNAAAEHDSTEQALQQLSEAADKLQELCVNVEAEVKGGANKSDESAQGADTATATAAGVRDALARVRAALEQLPKSSEENEGSAKGTVTTTEGLKADVLREVEAQVATTEQKTRQQQENALQNTRSRERMALLLNKAKELTTPAGAEQDVGSAGIASPAERLQVTEEYLKQLGARTLAGALTDLSKLLTAAKGQQEEGSSSHALAAGITLDATGADKLQQLDDLTVEINLADAVMRLELGSDTTATMSLLETYLQKVKEKHSRAEQEQEQISNEEEGVRTPPSVGVSPNLLKEQEAVERCGSLVAELRNDGLVLLGLAPGQYGQLAMLREAAANLSVSLDNLKYDRCVTALKDVSEQLGPIGAAIQVKLANTPEDLESVRDILTKQKQLAVDLYDRLKAFLSFEQNIRGPLKKALRELASLAGGIGAPRNTTGCTAAALKLDMAAEEAEKLQHLLSDLATSSGEAAEAPAPDSIAATQKIVTSLQETIEALTISFADFSSHVALRTRALNPEVAAAAAAAGVEGQDLQLHTLKSLEEELDHPLTILADAPEDQQAEWESLGLEQIARGRVATVLLATGITDSSSSSTSSREATAKAADPAAAGGKAVPRVSVPVPGLPSGKCVLQLLAERILRLQQQAATSTFGRHAPVTRQIQWYIMTSPATHDKLAADLKEYSYYGLSSRQVHLFNCKTAPPAFAGEPLKALTLGTATLTRGAADSGEVLPVLKRSGLLGHMRRSGIRHVEVNAVDDNVLARPADPLFIGFAAASGVDAAAKVVEPSTVAAAYAAAMSSSSSRQQQGEHTEEPSDTLDESISTLAPGIGSYYFSYAALSNAAGYYAKQPLAGYRLMPAAQLPSKAPTPAMSVNLPPNATQAQRMQAHQALLAAQQAAANAPPKPIDGYVPIRVLSDVFATAGGSRPLANAKLAYFGVEREEELSCLFGGGPHYVVPEPEIAAGDLLALTTSWVENQGGVVECEEGVEVSPLVSYAGEGLDAVVSEGQTFAEPYDLALQGATAHGKPKHNAGGLGVVMLAAYAIGTGLALTKQLISKGR